MKPIYIYLISKTFSNKTFSNEQTFCVLFQGINKLCVWGENNSLKCLAFNGVFSVDEALRVNVHGKFIKISKLAMTYYFKEGVDDNNN